MRHFKMLYVHLQIAFTVCTLTFLSSSTLIARESISSPVITFPTDGPVHNSSGMCTAEPTGELILSGVPPSLFLDFALLSITYSGPVNTDTLKHVLKTQEEKLQELPLCL